MIGTSESKEPVSPSGTILYFTVSDLQAVYTSLKDQGVTFLQEPHHVAKTPDHDLWMAFLNDPDGNTLGLMSEVPHASQS